MTFKNSSYIGFEPATANSKAIMSFGAPPNTTMSINSCKNPSLNTPPNYQFNGTIQLYGFAPSGGFSNIMEVGFDGINAVIDATGTSLDPDANRLLLNYYCGHDVFVGNSNGGDLTANRNMLVNGNMGIGISQQDLNAIPLGYRLIVEGTIGAREMRIVNPAQPWPDYVFADDYKLKSLSDVEQFVESNKHLPGFAPAATVASEGQNIGQLQVLQQQTIEEMYLHIIALEKRISKLEQENKKLKTKRP